MSYNNHSIEEFTSNLTTIFTEQQNNRGNIKATTLAERLEKLEKLKAGIIKHKDNIAEAIYKDFQRPKAASYAIEVGLMINHLHYTMEHLPNWIKSEKIIPASAPVDHPYSTEIIYEPKGVVLIMGPWNVPFFLTLYPLISSIAAGNTSIIKPSELTPNNSAVIKTLIEEIFDPKEVAVVEGGIPETTEILKLPFDHIYFTGSPKVAKIVMHAAAENLSSITLELGGKAPAIIGESADLNKTVQRLMKAKAINAGQICMDVDYILVPEKLQESFITQSIEFFKEAYHSNGKDFDYTDYDQIINTANFNRLKTLYEDAVNKGAKVEYGGIFEENLRKIQPTLLTNVSLDSNIMKEEIFGPLLPIIAYQTIEEALSIVANIEKPLGLYIFSEEDQFTEYVLQNTTAGGTAVNEVMLQAFDPALPFGGVNTSGLGKGYGHHGFKELSNARAVLYMDSAAPIDDFLQAPYEGKAEMIRPSFE